MLITKYLKTLLSKNALSFVSWNLVAEDLEKTELSAKSKLINWPQNWEPTQSVIQLRSWF